MSTWTNIGKATATWANKALPDIIYLWGSIYLPWKLTNYPWLKKNTYSEWSAGTKNNSSWVNATKH